MKTKKVEGIVDIAKFIPGIVAIIHKNLGTSYEIHIDDEGQDSRVRINTKNWMLNWDVLEPLAQFCIKNDITWEIQNVKDQELIIQISTKMTY